MAEQRTLGFAVRHYYESRAVPGEHWPFPKPVRVVVATPDGHIKAEWYEDEPVWIEPLPERTLA